MAQGFQLANPRMRFFDSNGAPLALGKLYAYVAGSSTPQDTWQNSDLTSLNTNPIVLSASGECTIFVPSATLYKFDLYSSADVHQAGWPIDGVEAIPAPDPPAPTPSPIPTGGIFAYGGTSAPSGYLLCDGALVSRTTYAVLFTAIGTAFGAGDGMTTFGVPDLQQRFPLGKASSGTGSTLGGTGGAIDHTHTGPSHTHTTSLSLSHTHSIGSSDHTHTVTVQRDGWGVLTNTPSVGGRLDVGDTTNPFPQATTSQLFSTSSNGTGLSATGADDPGYVATTSAGGTGNTGTANAPFVAVNYLIKT